ncbi:MAG TPA: phosphatase PAP2 family protein [Gemmatimonadaceae bacterium]|nr:phosphatase PAP2 family protein [Gemmatimonadaceae bacterium]
MIRSHSLARTAAVALAVALALTAGQPPRRHLLAQNPSRAAFGAAPLTPRTIGNEIRIAVADVLFIWSSPFRAEWRDLEALGAVGLATVAVGSLDQEIDRALTNHPSSVVRKALEPLEEDSDLPFYDLATGRRINPISGVLYAAGLVFRQPALREAGLGCLSAYWSNSTARHLVYKSIARPRPSINPENPYFIKYEADPPWDYHSFFGGHASNAITCVTFVNHRFALGYAEPALYTLGVGLSVVRMADRRHWASDTVLGMAFGYAVGKAVAHRYAKRDAAARSAAGTTGGSAGGGDADSPGLVLLIVDGLHAEHNAGVSYVGWRTTF